SLAKQVDQQKATFHSAAAAQVKAWREAAEKFQSEATKIVAARRTDLDAAVKQMKADAAEAEARLQKLKQAGSESWAGLSAALAAQSVVGGLLVGILIGRLLGRR